MGRQRSPSFFEARKMYIESNGDMKLIDIAAKVGVSDVQIRKWKSKDNWASQLDGTVDTDIEVPVQQPEAKVTLPLSKSNVTKSKGNVTNEVKEMDSGSNDMDIEDILSISEDSGLSDKQQLFCLYYVKYRNKTKAYQKAYESTWMNANKNAHKVWSNTGVRQEVERLLAQFRENINISIEDLFQWYLDIARADITDYVDFDTIEIETKDKQGNEIVVPINRVNIKDSDEIDGTLIGEISNGKDGVKVKLVDKMKAMDWLTKHIGLASEEQQKKVLLLQAQIDKITGDNNEMEDLSEIEDDVYGSN